MMSALTTTNTANHQWHSVQRSLQQVYVTRKSGSLPRPEEGSARLAMGSSSICGADVRIANGDKEAHTKGDAAVTMGHEGCGVIEFIPEGAQTHLCPGQFC